MRGVVHLDFSISMSSADDTSIIFISPYRETSALRLHPKKLIVRWETRVVGMIRNNGAQ